jgi:PleD family two-component response regulator
MVRHLGEAHAELELRTEQLEELQAQLREQADRDWLTGLHNRRYLAHRLEGVRSPNPARRRRVPGACATHATAPGLTVTASVGVASAPTSAGLEMLAKVADRRLSAAKDAGRNRVDAVFSDPMRDLAASD